MSKTKEQKIPEWFDFVMGASLLAEMGVFNTAKHIEDLRKGLDWFRKHNSKAYMVLLD